jgi:hypothetical protein
MPFTDTIAELPFTPRTPTASGFLPPMVRGMNHIVYLIGCMADEKVTVTPEEAIEELKHAQEHWNARTETQAVSTDSVTRATTIGRGIGEAITEFADWNEEQRITNLRNLTHRILQYTAELDRELVGIRDSDPGSSL